MEKRKRPKIHQNSLSKDDVVDNDIGKRNGQLGAVNKKISSSGRFDGEPNEASVAITLSKPKVSSLKSSEKKATTEPRKYKRAKAFVSSYDQAQQSGALASASDIVSQLRSKSLQLNSWEPISSPSFSSAMLNMNIAYLFPESTRADERQNFDQPVDNCVSNMPLREVPITFSSSQEYADVFLPLIFEECLEQVRNAIKNGNHQKQLIPWSCKIIEGQGSVLKANSQHHSAAGTSDHNERFLSTLNRKPNFDANNLEAVEKISRQFRSEISSPIFPVSLEFNVKTQRCRSGEELDHFKKRFNDSKIGFGKSMEESAASEFDFARPFVSANEISKGDLLLLSPKRSFWSDFHSHNAKVSSCGESADTTVPSYCLAIAQGNGQYRLQSTSTAGGFEFSISVRVRAAVSRIDNLPVRFMVWKLASCITAAREYDALTSVLRTSGVSRHILNVLLKGKNDESIQKMSESSQLDYLHTLKPNKDSIEDERLLHVAGATKHIDKWLRSEFNSSQHEAIVHSAINTRGFTLIQGPPGTGKTHTLVGLLNLLHLNVFQKYYDSIVPVVNPLKKGNNGSKTINKGGDRLDLLPHIIVAAPSNAAVDGIVLKLLERLFMDGSGKKYSPNIVRVYSSDDRFVGDQKNNHSCTKVSLDYIAAQRLKKLQSYSHEGKIDAHVLEIEQRVKCLVKDLRVARDQCLIEAENISKHMQERKRSKPEKTIYREQLKRFAQSFKCATSIYVKIHEKLEKTRLELQDCRLLQSSNSEEDIRKKLQQSILLQTHIVFVTLSSSGLKQIAELGRRFKFEVVVVDEAGQATEPSALIPLQQGVEHVVLVGDPKQLPATVISKRVQNLNFQQSLFERLQLAGHSTYLLDTQYRSHPIISAFPARYFYGGKLRSGGKVCKESYSLCFSRTHPALRCPLTFLNVSSGLEIRRMQSFCNEQEAALAVEIYKLIKHLFAGKCGLPSVCNSAKEMISEAKKVNRLAGAESHSEAQPPQSEKDAKLRIGIISPYRQQVDLIRTRLGKRNPNEPHLVDVNTVDGCQGREFDVVIFSCVRALQPSKKHCKGSNGQENGIKHTNIGFLNDERRLNVAVTRAKYLLLVLGNQDVLESSRMWKEFIDHIRNTGQVMEIKDEGSILSQNY